MEGGQRRSEQGLRGGCPHDVTDWMRMPKPRRVRCAGRQGRGPPPRHPLELRSPGGAWSPVRDRSRVERGVSPPEVRLAPRPNGGPDDARLRRRRREAGRGPPNPSPAVSCLLLTHKPQTAPGFGNRSQVHVRRKQVCSGRGGRALTCARNPARCCRGSARPARALRSVFIRRYFGRVL